MTRIRGKPIALKGRGSPNLYLYLCPTHALISLFAKHRPITLDAHVVSFGDRLMAHCRQHARTPLRDKM
jgi:hypothetical protein